MEEKSEECLTSLRTLLSTISGVSSDHHDMGFSAESSSHLLSPAHLHSPPGVRYAEPPTGDMRFKKPVAASWKREKLAQRAERVCLQYGFSK